MSPVFFLLNSILCFHTWMIWKSYDSEIRIDHAEIVADNLLLKEFQISQAKEEPWSYGKDAWMHIFRGNISLAEHNTLLAL